MKQLKLLTLALVAAFALSAVAAASAMAEKPELLKPNGTELVKRGFKSKFVAGTTIKFETKNGNRVVCSGATNTGEVLEKHPNHIEVEVTFTGCEEPTFKAKCDNTGTAGKIVVKSLGLFGYIKKEPLDVGILFAPREGTVFAEFTCGFFVLEKVEGKLICLVEPPNKEVKTTEHYTLKCKIEAGTKGKQEFQKFEGGENEHLTTSTNGAAPEESAMEIEETIQGEEASEIFA
jgi:hypothetical protein